MILSRVKKRSGLTFGTWTCLIAVTCAAVTTVPCDKTRQVFTKASGIITDGPAGKNYTKDSHCEWLIKAQNDSQFITLKFRSMGTECSYDYVFIYDGDSYQSSLLGSFSGKTEPQEITATSGYMLILLYSDTNYVLDGFKAEFYVHNCPNNCSERGACVSHVCVCEGDWGGKDCSVQLCPKACSHHGICREGRCQCYDGYSGVSCSLDSYDFYGNKWHWLSHTHDGLSPRAAHSAIYINYTDSLYVYGGYDLNKVLGTLQIYRFSKSHWEDELGNIIHPQSSGMVDQAILKEVLTQDASNPRWGLNRVSFLNQFLLTPINNNIHKLSGLHSNVNDEEIDYSMDTVNMKDVTKPNVTTIVKPIARYGHGACEVESGFAIYGGKLINGSLSAELWVYNITSRLWSLRAQNSTINPPPLTRHTLTRVRDEIYLFGGSTSDGEFSSRLFKIKLDINLTENWEEVYPRGGKELDVRVVAHTAVYHLYSHSIIVYGGIVAGVARFSLLSDKMFAFDIENKYWSELHYPRAHLRDMYVPRERAFHTATIIGNYLIVFGGYSHRHNKEEICYDNQMYMYHLGCHTWISGEVLGGTTNNAGYPKTQGVFAHAAALRPPSTLLLIGGYHGNVNGDLLAFVIPGWLSGISNNDPEAACPQHRTHAECLADPECGWCSADEICYGRTIGSNCTTNLQSVRCGGICPALGDCHACLIHGAPIVSSDNQMRKPLPSISEKLGLHHCTWCVQNARCHHKDDNYGVCGEETPSQTPGWWGSVGTEIAQPSQCRSLDKRPGLTFIKYQHPVNWTYPDQVSIINATTIDFNIANSAQDHTDSEMVAQLHGFLHIPSTWAGTGEGLRVCAGHAHVILYLGQKQVASNLSAFESSSCVEAKWPPLKAGRLAVDFQATKPLSSAITHNGNHQSKMELHHNKSNENPKVFTFEYLEPFSNGSCNLYDNCLHCLADSACGWCELTNECVSRSVDETQNCTLEENWRYLTLQPSFCPNCSNYISCSHCLQSNGCEWWAEEAHCSRRGRSAEAVKSLEQCPQACHERTNCSTCLDERGRCVWCEGTQQCFSFNVYTSEYQFGLCREWLDRAVVTNNGNALDNVNRRSGQCKSCDHHSNCSSCLTSLSCGWCYSRENPIKGTCVQGDFGKPQSQCGELLNISSYDAQWAYAQCPDVDECGLGIHDCHKEAICTNTHGSYSCKCLRGFIGDGRKTCTKTCYNNCVHGYCLGAPDYKCLCDLGWTGVDCANNCGCNNHSTCTRGIGICDDCQDWTEDEFCDQCKTGSYGNATSDHGCRRCDCNGHGDDSIGVCDSQTGECYCKDNTMGPNCEKCRNGYYGDPRRGGSCYFQCEARGMLSNVTNQGLGSHMTHISPWGGPKVKECLWIISPGNISKSGLIQLTIESARLNVSCADNAVYAYDGFPDLVGSQPNQLIGVFCSDASPTTVEAKSGHLTVHYRQGTHGQGFEAVYNILSCESGCVSPRICKNNNCICPENFAGLNCEKETCPNNCSAIVKQGTCDKGYGRCLCASGWGGNDCASKLHPHQLIFTELFNSRHLADSLEHLRKVLPRFGHTLVADKRGSLWMFGGFSLSHGPLNDIRLFDTRNNTWIPVTVEATPEAKMPEGRYFHAAEMIHVRQIIYVYGGLTVQGTEAQNRTLGDFWQFSLKDQRWGIIVRDVQPPALAGHTLTLQKHQESETLVLIGGLSMEQGFLSDVWEYDLEKGKWEILKTKGAKPVGICGHSTVYHSHTQSFYVFGGYLYSSNGTYPSNKLYALNYQTVTWNELPTLPELNPPGLNLPRARFLHSAVTTEDYMLVFGGQTFPHNATDLLSAYVYNCNQWIRLIKNVDVIGELPPPTYAHAMTLDAESGVLYVVGGWDGGAQCQVTRIMLPSDLCRLWSSGKYACRSHMGCSFCTVYPLGGSNSTHCYSNGKLDLCVGHNATVITNNGASCDSALIAKRLCSNFTTCDTCLASWPSHNETKPICQWCANGCGAGKCSPYGGDCPTNINNCDSKIFNLSNIDSCPRKCTASDCNQCLQENCFWTRQVFQTDDSSVKISEDSVHNWMCVSKEDVSKATFKVKDSVVGLGNTWEVCPQKCHTYTECHTCLKAKGAEGGSHECYWATHLNQCIAPSYQPLYCAGGVCGLVIRPDEKEQCPSPCSNFTQCDECLHHTHCGWCGKEGGNGEGVCTEGSLAGPSEHSLHPTCKALFIQHHSIVLYPNDTVLWHFVRCPPENECENGHHKCDPVSEHCEDLFLEYKCVCGPGHRDAGGKCVPVCTQGCVRGSCTKPDVCECDFGYVGANCSIQCQCNGHANCEGPDKLDKCLECQNNTMGDQCEKCKSLFVGDPVNNGQCVPCSTYCNGHSNICLSETSDPVMISPDMSSSQGENFLSENSIAKAKCVKCTNNTDGPRCDKCISGYFRGNEDYRSPCRLCECHGHGDICDAVTGEKCNCGNNTESDATCQTSSLSKNSAQECWRYQCVKCKDSYMGDPKNGHQCYKMMTADNKMCFDGKLIDECKVKPKLLNAGHTVFFVVIPRFMNVDIRVIIDVTQGALDVFMSPNDSSFVVSVNGSSGAHNVELDPSFLRHGSDSPYNVDAFFGNNTTDKVYKSKSYDGIIEYTLMKYQAEGLNTYVTIDKKNTLLWVQGLKNRLVLTLPQLVHDLGYTKFYLVLKGSSGDDGTIGGSKGMVFFRQDQLHIDLFVFFSVFFSCFFLFLAACVVTWKAKQAADVRRARRRHAVEMLTMAKRPFAMITLMLAPQSSPTQRRRTRAKSLITTTEVRPVAVEPTEDGLAAVTSVFVRLPGGRAAPARLALASSLVLLSRQLPSSGRTFLRRRSVHNAQAPPT